MSAGGWPYLPGQCPSCMYFVEAPSPFVDEQGYEILGACAHPRIGMELFRPKERATSKSERCPCFVRARSLPGSSTGTS